MVSSVFDTGSVHAVRRPVFEVSFGSGSPDDWGQNVASVTVQAGLTPSVGVVEVYLDGGDQAPATAVGDSGSVSFGYEDGIAELIFTGQVEEVCQDVRGGTRVTASDGGAVLSTQRINQSYEQQKAGDIVSDLAGRAGVGTDTVEDGVEFPFYVVDDRRSAYRHIAALARRSGYLAYFTPENKLNFAPFASSQPVQTFSYGEVIISLRTTKIAAVVGAVTTVGEGAAGSQGQEAWSWLVKDPSSVTSSAGSDGAERQIQDASLRSADAARSAAEGIANATDRTGLTGELLVPGSPAVVVGSVVEIVDAPQDALNGLYLVTGVRHRFSKAKGFTSLARLAKTDGGGLGRLL
ncbi:MAG: contractile injection system protein, VgrG/Pvc8 family [Actinomycetota bacterium]|nr:contractile injection system protein, VgrG/Pvc8 family [Actinomycetota bacterium]